MKNFNFHILHKNKIFVAFVFILINLKLVAQPASPPPIEYESHSIYVKTWDSSSVKISYSPVFLTPPTSGINAVFLNYGVSDVSVPFSACSDLMFMHIYKITFLNGSPEDFINALQVFSYIEYAEKVPVKRPLIVPNDPNQPYQMALMNAYDAFDIYHGSPSSYKATIAVVDDAVLTTHEDLKGNTITGHDVADMDANANPPLSGSNSANSLYFSHGTYIAGVSSAVTDNSKGLASISWNNSNIMPVKCVKDNGNPGFFEFAYQGVCWASENGADIINMSWGGYGYSQSEFNVIKEVAAKGIILVSSAGNYNTNTPIYPAAYGEGTTNQSWETLDSKMILCVASIDASGDRSSHWLGGQGSHYGHWVDISAYGTGIYTTAAGSASGMPVDNVYGTYSGTSVAAPQVSGLAALLKSYQPTKTASEIIDCILGSANNDIYNPVLHPNNIFGTLGSGRIDAKKALECLSGCQHPFAYISPSRITLCPGGEVELTSTTADSYLWSTGGNNQTITVNMPGDYTVTVTLNGGCTATASITIYPLPSFSEIDIFELSGITPNDGNTCGQDLYTLTAPSGSSYSWNVNSLNYPWVTTQAATFIGPGSGLPLSSIYVVTVTDVYGCIGLTGTATATVNTFNNPVGNLVVTEASGVANDGLICVGSSVLLEASGGVNYLWSTGSTNASINVSPNTSTTYTVTVSNAEGCYVTLKKVITVSTCQTYNSCAPCTTGLTSLNITASNAGTKYSSLNLPTTLTNYLCITISGTLIIDVNVEITGCLQFRMSAGSEIIVGENNQLGFNPTFRVEKCAIYGCEQMWKGITVSPFAHLIFKENTIRDAEHAITAWASPAIFMYPLATQIEIKNNQFIDNHVSLYFPKDTNVSWGNVRHYPIEGNQFTSVLNNLLPPTNVYLANYESSSGYAGVVSEGGEGFLDIGTPGSSGYTNEFSRLRNGILSDGGTWLNVNRCDFKDIFGYMDVGAANASTGFSKGISVLANGGFSYINNSRFNKCGHAISSTRSFLFANENKIEDSYVGIQANSPISLQINNKDNAQQEIKFRDYGVLARNLTQWFNYSYFSIENNHFENLNTIPDYNKGNLKSAIFIDDATNPDFPDGHAKISQNMIDLENTFDGITLRNVNNWLINDNDINLTSAAAFTSKGIFIENSNSNYILNNMIDGDFMNPHPTPYPDYEDSKAVFVNSSYETEFCCNITGGTVSGTEFMGPAESTVFRTTNFGNHYYNIKCSEASIIGLQPDLTLEPNGNYGNVFTEVISGIARHDGDDILIEDSKFNVKDHLQPNYPITISTSNSNAQWFNITGYEPDLCSECAGPSPVPPRRTRFEDTDLHFIDGSYLNTRFGPMITWDGQLGLFKHLDEDTKMRELSPYLSKFYDESQIGDIGKFSEVDKSISGALENANTLVSDFETALNQRLIAQTNINRLLDNLSVTTSYLDSLIIYSKVDSIQMFNLNTYTNIISYTHSADSVRQAKCALALLQNEQLPDTTILQYNRKTVNRIYLQTLGRGIYTLSDQQFNEISTIAHECPLVGGKSVYKARSLYFLREQKKFRDDISCFSTGLKEQSRSTLLKNSSLDSLIIAPNPLDNLLTVYFPNRFHSDESISLLKIRIIDMKGAVVFESNHNSTYEPFTLDVSRFGSGLYLLVASFNNKETKQSKFIIQH